MHEHLLSSPDDSVVVSIYGSPIHHPSYNDLSSGRRRRRLHFDIWEREPRQVDEIDTAANQNVRTGVSVAHVNFLEDLMSQDLPPPRGDKPGLENRSAARQAPVFAVLQSGVLGENFLINRSKLSPKCRDP